MSHHRRISLRRVQALELSTATTPVRLRNPFLLALRRIMWMFSSLKRPQRVGVLRLGSLNEHLLRDLGLTNHVEQPWR